MLALSIVVRFDVFKDTDACLLATGVEFAMHQLDFQTMEETLHSCIIVAGRLPAHAASQFIHSNQPLVAFRTVLTAPVRMDDH